MAECEHLARTSAYFDGAIAPDDEAAAVAHLAHCAECQALLGSAVAFDAVLSSAPRGAGRADQLAARRSRRWPVVAAGAATALAAAAALAVWLGRPDRPHDDRAAIALADQRAVEAWFTGPAFAPHRPLGVLRGDRARESIPLATLAALERGGRIPDLVAALASTRDLARAEELAGTLGESAAAETDRAALALAAGDPERALGHAYHAVDRAPGLQPAWWNLGLAARDLGLPHLARQAFARIADPGWAREARAIAEPLDREIARQGSDYDGLVRRGAAMIAGGPPITVADVRAFPGWSRLVFHDALRVAGSRGDAEALRPLARELDAASGAPTAMAAIDRVAASDFAIRGRFVARYRALAAHTAAPAELAGLLADLRAAGPPVADLYVGAAGLANEVGPRADELLEIVRPWGDPWFELYIERERIRRAHPGGDLRAEPLLAAALARCTSSAWSLRCGALARELAVVLAATGREVEAEARARAAVEFFQHAMVPGVLHHARSILADLHRDRGRRGLARAELEEVVLAVGDRDCNTRRYAQIGRAGLAFVDRDFAAVRAALPPAELPPGCTPTGDVIGLAVAVDLARATGDPGDAGVARAWIERARAGSAGLATVADARLRGETSALAGWLASHPASDAVGRAVREWGYVTLESAAGARGDWAGVVALAAAETPVPDAPCLAVASTDDDLVTVAVRTGATVIGSARRIAASELARTAIFTPELTRALDGCRGIAVVARPPLHGRFDLLPATLPWWFAGEARGAAPPSARREIQVIDARPPAGLLDLPSLPQLAPSRQPFDATISGDAATPGRVLRALGDASYAELHVHGIAATADAGAAFLALSPEAGGEFALRAADLRRARLTAAPIIVLAACRAAASGSHERFSLPDAFLAAGARAVIAADAPIPDAAARPVFDELHRRIAAGEPPAAALAAIRASREAWARHLMLFQ